MTANAEALLEGPRGRRLCLELAADLHQDLASAVFSLSYDLDPGKGTSVIRFGLVTGETGEPDETPSPKDVAGLLASLDAFNLTEEQLSAALEGSVRTAYYWQPPDGTDVLAALPVIRAALVPLAERIMATPSAQEWRQARRTEQWAVDWRSPQDPAPLPQNPSSTLQRWAQEIRAEEVQAARERPEDPRANWSGSWWSAPLGLIRSVGRIPAALDLVEDAMGWEDATVIPVHGRGRTFEIRTADDWRFLCRTYPLEVTASRRHDWFQTTGRNGRWVIPDWQQVAADWDAVHLTALGYLSSATRALDVDAGTASVIAGWDPDSTLWLTDVAHEGSDHRQFWHRDAQGEPWARNGTA